MPHAVYESQAAAMDDGLTVVQSFEQLVELAYTLQVHPWLTVRPDLQWIARPDASKTRSSIWAAGLVFNASV
ncbi:carbohydrate porin [Frateuria aurantia]